MISQLMQAIAPNYCCGCGLPGAILCASCAKNITSEPFVRCAACVAGPAGATGMCGRCRPSYQRIWVAGTHEGVLDRAIHAYKFDVARDGSGPLAAVLVDVTPMLPPQTVLVPIPTARQHVRARGFDHMQLLSKRLARLKSVSYDASLLGRRTNDVQREATAIQRRAQAKKMFHVRGAADPEAIYVLIDDVMTTGSTITYAAKALKQAGATQVWAIVLARQVLS